MTQDARGSGGLASELNQIQLALAGFGGPLLVWAYGIVLGVLCARAIVSSRSGSDMAREAKK